MNASTLREDLILVTQHVAEIIEALNDTLQHRDQTVVTLHSAGMHADEIARLSGLHLIDIERLVAARHDRAHRPILRQRIKWASVRSQRYSLPHLPWRSPLGHVSQ